MRAFDQLLHLRNLNLRYNDCIDEHFNSTSAMLIPDQYTGVIRDNDLHRKLRERCAQKNYSSNNNNGNVGHRSIF